MTTINKEVCICGDILGVTPEEICSCNDSYTTSSKCPLCGELLYEVIDNAMSTYCSNTKCDYMFNQYMTYKEMKENDLENQIEWDNLKLKVIETCSKLVQEEFNTLGDNKITQLGYDYIDITLKSDVGECNESWCDSCTLKKVSGVTCDRLHELIV